MRKGKREREREREGEGGREGEGEEKEFTSDRPYSLVFRYSSNPSG